MSELLKQFIEKHNINLETIYNDLRIYEEREINHIISDNKLEGIIKEELVSIADIIGYDYSWRRQTNNLADNFSSFFGTESAYQIRSIGMLEYDNEEIIQQLYPSFKKEPLRVLELDNGRKVISGNGLHRYTILRMHYMSELQKVRGNKEKEEYLKRKYEIPVKLTKVDLFKTYCQFLLKKACINDEIYLHNIYGEDDCVIIHENNHEMKLNRKQLLEYTKNKINMLNDEIKDMFKHVVSIYYNRYSSFKMFVDENFSAELIPIIEESNKKERGI